MKKAFYIITSLLTLIIIGCTDGELVTPGNEFDDPTQEVESGTFTADLDGVFNDFSLGSKAVISNTDLFVINGVTQEGQLLQISGGINPETFNPNPLAVGTLTEEDAAAITLTLDASDFNTVYTNIDEEGNRYPTIIDITKVDMEDLKTSGTFSTTVRNTTSGELIEITNGIFEDVTIESAAPEEPEVEALFITYNIIGENGDNIPFNFNDNILTETTSNTKISGGTAQDRVVLSFPNGGLNVGIHDTSEPSEENYYAVITYQGVEYNTIGGPLEITSINGDYIEGNFNLVAEDGNGNQITVVDGTYKASAP